MASCPAPDTASGRESGLWGRCCSGERSKDELLKKYNVIPKERMLEFGRTVTMETNYYQDVPKQIDPRLITTTDGFMMKKS